MLCRQNRQQLHKIVQILWRDLSYAYAGNDLGEDETGQNTDPRQSDSRSEGWILCYPYGCCANVSILVQYLEFELQYLHKEVARGRRGKQLEEFFLIG